MKETGCLSTLLAIFLITGIAVYASLLPESIFQISQKAEEKMQSYDNQMKDLNNKAMAAFQKGDETLFASYKSQADALDKKKNKLHKNTLDSINSEIGKGIPINIIQKNYQDIYSIESKAIITKAVWNPQSRPHVTIKLKAKLKKKLTHKTRKFKINFQNDTGKTISEQIFYLSAGTFLFKTKPGMEVEFYGNPKIFQLEGVSKAVIK